MKKKLAIRPKLCYNTTMKEREIEFTQWRLKRLQERYDKQPNIITLMEIWKLEKRLIKAQKKPCNSAKTML